MAHSVGDGLNKDRIHRLNTVRRSWILGGRLHFPGLMDFLSSLMRQAGYRGEEGRELLQRPLFG